MVDVNKYLRGGKEGPLVESDPTKIDPITGEGIYADQHKGKLPGEYLLQGRTEDSPMPGIMQKLGLGYQANKMDELGAKIPGLNQALGTLMGGVLGPGATHRKPGEATNLSSTIAMMAIPDLRNNTKRYEGKDLREKALGLGEDLVRGFSSIPMGESVEETTKKIEEGDPLTIGMLAMYGGGGKLIGPITKYAGKAAKGASGGIFKGAQKVTDLLAENPIAKKWEQGVEKFWGNTVNYLTVPEKSLLKDTRLPEQFKKFADKTMTPVQQGGKLLREKLQPAVERLNPETQDVVRRAKAQASLLVNEDTRLGGVLADPSFSLADKMDVFKAMRGTSIRHMSPEVKDLMKIHRGRLKEIGVDPFILKSFQEHRSKLYTELVKSPEDVLSNPKLRELMENLDTAIPDDKWFRQGRIRKSIGDAISDPGMDPASATLLKEMFSLPATVPEKGLEASQFAMRAYLERSLKELKGPKSMLSPPGATPPPGYVPAKWGGLGKEGYYMHKDLALELESYNKIQKNAQGILSTYFTSPWKTMKIVMSPAAQMRNTFTSFILNDIGGLPVYRMDVYAQAVAGMAKNHDTWKDFARLTGGGGTFAHNELSQLSTSWKYHTEWYDMPNKVLEKTSKYPKQFYNANEQVFKYAKYLHNLEKGMSKADAAADAIIPTFNYSEITPAVSFARSHLMPFATWTSKVIPYTFEMAVKHPVRVGKWFAMFQGLQSYALEQAGMNEEEWEHYKKQWPEYMQKGVYMLLPWRDSRDRLNMVDLTYAVPGVGDIRELTGRGIWESVFQHPALTVPADLLRNKKFSGAPVYYNWESPVMKAWKSVGHVSEAVMPSWFGPWGTDYKKYVRAMSEEPGAMTMGQAIASQFGAKMQPLDDRKIYAVKDAMQRMYLAEITNAMKKDLRLAGDNQDKAYEISRKYAEIRRRFILESMGLDDDDDD